MRALLALLKLRGAPHKLITQVTKFVKDARGTSVQRNRIVHDAWMRRQDGSRIIGRLEITAPQKLKMEMIDTDLSSLVDEYRKIELFKRRSEEMRSAIYDVLPSLQEIPPEQFQIR